MQQTKTTFAGQISQQHIQDIPCEVIKVTPEKSELTEVPKENELNEKMDTSVNEEDTEQSFPRTE